MRPVKALSFLICFLLISLSPKAQDRFYHSMGATVAAGYSSIEDVYYAMAQYTYVPRFNLAQMSNGSISLSVPTSVGAGFSVDGLVYGGGIRGLAEYNFGLGAHSETESNFGFHVGAGIGVGYTAADVIDQGATFGPVIRAGARFNIMDMTMGTAVFYQKGLEEEKWHTIGIQILFDL